MPHLFNILRGWGGKRGESASVESPVPEPEKPVIRNEIAISALTAELFGGYKTASGMAVTERTALSVSAVFACVSLIAGAIASLPLPIYRTTKDGRERVDHPVGRLLNRSPSPLCTSAVFWEFLVTSLLLQGDAFARIVRKGAFSPDIISLEPWHAGNVGVERVDGRMKYHLADPETGKVTVVDQDDMLHVPGIGYNGLRGLTPLSYALRDAVGIALAANTTTARFFGNGARPDFVITADKDSAPLTKEQAEALRTAWEEVYGGPHRSYKPAILGGGMQLQQLSLNSVDAQLLATRSLQAEDIARIFGTPPHMIGLTEKTTSYGSGVEQMSIGFVKYTLMRHLTKLEQEINRKLLRDTDLFAEFTTAGLERGDLKSRYDAHRAAIGRAGEPGFMTVNEVRRLENLPPVEGGDTLNKGDTNATDVQTSGAKP